MGERIAFAPLRKEKRQAWIALELARMGRQARREENRASIRHCGDVDEAGEGRAALRQARQSAGANRAQQKLRFRQSVIGWRGWLRGGRDCAGLGTRHESFFV